MKPKPKPKKKKTHLQQIHLIQKQINIHLCQELIRHDHSPQEKWISKTVKTRIFSGDLFECGDGSEEDEGVDVGEVGDPGVALIDYGKGRRRF